MREYRLHISVPASPSRRSRVWEPLIGFLETHRGELGPVISWDEERVAVVTVAVDSDDEARAAEICVGAVSDALHRTGLGHLYPRSVEIDPVGDYAAA